jgi:hypothetical protein
MCLQWISKQDHNQIWIYDENSYKVNVIIDIHILVKWNIKKNLSIQIDIKAISNVHMKNPSNDTSQGCSPPLLLGTSLLMHYFKSLVGDYKFLSPTP